MTPTLEAAPLLAVLTLLAAVASSPAMSAAQEPELLDPEKAFRISTRALGQRLGARSTPTWFLPDDTRYMGALPMSQVVPLLDATAPRR